MSDDLVRRLTEGQSYCGMCGAMAVERNSRDQYICTACLYEVRPNHGTALRWEAAARIEALTAENAKLREAAEQWLLMEFDDGSKVFLSSISGGGHPHGEFHTVMLRKEIPGGAKFTRELVASSDWMPCVLTTEPPK